MKHKILLSVVLLFIVLSQAKAQFPIPVTDGAHISESMKFWIVEILREKKKVEEMISITNKMRENLEMYTKLSNAVKNSNYMAYMLSRQYSTVNILSDALSFDGEIASEKSHAIYLDKIRELKEQVNDNISQANSIISNAVEMNDGERMQQCNLLEEDAMDTSAALEMVVFEYRLHNNKLLALKKTLK